MASNNPTSLWIVKIKSIPTSVNIFQLAQLIDLPKSRIYVPKDKSSGVPYAWVNGFANEEEAKKFAAQWSVKTILHRTIKCVVSQRADGTGAIHTHQERHTDENRNLLQQGHKRDQRFQQEEVSKDEEFVLSDMCSRNLSCNGRPCASCKKCRDWYYTGDLKGWKWIQDYNNLKVRDWERFYRGELAERFKRRDDAKCSRSYFIDHDTDRDDYCAFRDNVCFCEDNINIRS